MLSWRLAWRNIWRNGRRSAITIVAIALNTAVLLVVFGLVNGMFERFVQNATQLVVGEAQVHRQGYLASRTLYDVVDGATTLITAARARGIEAAPRSFGFGLVASGTKSAGASFWGVDPGAEARTVKLTERLAEGRGLDESSRGEVVLGKRLARSLDADVGDEVVAVVQAADGSLGNEAYRIVGILGSVGEDIDRNVIFIHRRDFASLFSTDAVHEVVLNSWGTVPVSEIALRIAPELTLAPTSEFKTWRQLLPQLSDMLNLAGAPIFIFGFVFFLAAAMGVLNTMLMATHDRIREYGILKALGATPSRILRDVATEAWLLCVVATSAGLVLGLLMHWYLSVYGLDLSSFGSGDIRFAGMVYESIWYSRLRWWDVFQTVVPMWAVCVTAALYPAIKAARLEAARAMGQP